jgi:hypothetical protein
MGTRGGRSVNYSPRTLSREFHVEFLCENLARSAMRVGSNFLLRSQVKMGSLADSDGRESIKPRR